MIVPITKIANSAIVVAYIDSQPSSTILADDICHKLVVTRAVTAAPHADTAVSVISVCPGRRATEPINDNTSCEHPQIAREVVDVRLSKPFHILLKNVATKPGHLQKRMYVAHVTNSSALVIATEAALLETNSAIIGAVHYKPSVDRGSQMTLYKYVEARGGQSLNLDGKSEA